MEEVIKQINTFDNFYEMSDDPRIYNTYFRLEKEIKSTLGALSEEKLTKVVSNLTDAGTRVYERYFKRTRD
jgi:hypothetical protein